MTTQAEQFFAQYSELEEAENWQEIIRLGRSVLAERGLNFQQRGEVACKICSSAFYLGNYVLALKKAYIGLVYADSCENKDLTAHSLYLISAVYRALAQTSRERYEKDKRFATAAIEEASRLLEDPEVCDVIRAKIYFNRAALKHDLDHNWQEAMADYSRALELFEAGSEYHNRTAIRYTRCLLESGDIVGAKEKAAQLNINPETRTGIHLLLVKTKILVRSGEYQEAMDCALTGIENARKKHMGCELGMFQELLITIQPHLPPASHLEGGSMMPAHQEEQKTR